MTPFSPLNSTYSSLFLRLPLNNRKRGYLSDLAASCLASFAAASNLARIKIDNNQLEKISKELEAVMGWIDSLSEVETSGIEPVANVTGQKLPLREDKVTDGGYSDKILNNAPEKEGGFFVVPKVIE